MCQRREVGFLDSRAGKGIEHGNRTYSYSPYHSYPTDPHEVAELGTKFADSLSFTRIGEHPKS